MNDANYQILGVSSWKDRVLFTLGPLTTSLSVKQQVLHDFGSWEAGFNNLVREIRQRLLPPTTGLCGPSLPADPRIHGNSSFSPRS